MILGTGNARPPTAADVNLRGMGPIVTAAIVSVSGTVIVGVAGFGASIWNARKANTHDQQRRVWDRRADVYVDTLAAMQYRHLKRRVEMSGSIYMLDGRAQQNYLGDLAASATPNWSQIEARLQAFASEPVFTAVKATSAAHFGVVVKHDFFREHADGVNRRSLMKDADEALIAAEGADAAAIELIRAELQGRGQRPLGDYLKLATICPGQSDEQGTGSAGRGGAGDRVQPVSLKLARGVRRSNGTGWDRLGLACPHEPGGIGPVYAAGTSA